MRLRVVGLFQASLQLPGQLLHDRFHEQAAAITGKRDDARFLSITAHHEAAVFLGIPCVNRRKKRDRTRIEFWLVPAVGAAVHRCHKVSIGGEPTPGATQAAGANQRPTHNAKRVPRRIAYRAVQALGPGMMPPCGHRMRHVYQGQQSQYVAALSDRVACAYISAIEVRPEYRKRGIGMALLSRMTEQLSVYGTYLSCAPQ